MNLVELLAHPPREFSPAPFWWWNGDRLDSDRLRWQLERFVEGGTYNVMVVHLAPNGPLHGAEGAIPTHFSEEWWVIYRRMLHDARALGVSIWLYDQLGFGSADKQQDLVHEDPAFAGQWIERVVVDCDGTGSSVELTCPVDGQPLGACALRLDATGGPIGEPIALELDGRGVHWQRTEPHRVMLFYARSHPGGWSSSASARDFDYLNPAACARLIDCLYGEYERRVGEHLGTTIVGSFQDEMPSIPTWSRVLVEEFRRRRGYDLVPHLAHLWEELSPASALIRVDYHTVRAELVEEGFNRPLFAWHERRGLIQGFDQEARSGTPTPSARDYADYLRTHRWFGAPGTDQHGDAKLHSSIAHLYDRPRVWFEAFHSSGWGATLEETLDWLIPWLRGGVTLFNPHAAYYSTHGGWWEWAAPSYCWRQPYWRHYRTFADAVARLCAILSQGDHVCDIGILYPVTTAHAGLLNDGITPTAQLADDIYRKLVGTMYWQRMEPGILDRDGRDFDVLDDASVQRGRVEQEPIGGAPGGCLQIGRERYRAIILPACMVIQAATAEVLLRFVDQGGLLIAVGEPPQLAVEGTGLRDGSHPSIAALTTLLASGKAIQVPSAADVPTALSGLVRRVEAPVPTLLRRVGDAHILFVPRVYPYSSIDRWTGFGNQANYTFDPPRDPQEHEIAVRGLRGAPELWNIETGERTQLGVVRRGDTSIVRVPFETGPAALLVWPDPATGIAASGGKRPDTKTGEQLLTGPWSTQLLPTTDNRWGDLARPPDPGPLPIQRWTFRYRRETPGEDGLVMGWHQPAADDADWRDADGIDAGLEPGRINGPYAESRDLWRGIVATYGTCGWWRKQPGDGGWRPIVYSPSRGIWRDRMHLRREGAKGRVPEEFLDFGNVTAGEVVEARVPIRAERSERVHLAIGAAAAKTASINGESLGTGGAEYLWLTPALLGEGHNTIELQLTAEEDGWLRASLALVRDVEAFIRPEWMVPADGIQAGTRLRFETAFTLGFEPQAARLQVALEAPGRVIVNGREAGEQDGFPYYIGERMPRARRYDLRSLIQPGHNDVAIELVDIGKPVAVLVDGLFEAARDGDESSTTLRYALASGAGWRLQRAGAPAALTLRRRQWLEPSYVHLWTRPHPLPETAWLEGGEPSNAVVRLVTDHAAHKRRVEWLHFLVPPGATTMELPVTGDMRVFVDGAEQPVSAGHVTLPHPERLRRRCAVRVEGATGGLEGGLLGGPALFACGGGTMEVGDWAEQGLVAYAGGVAYRRLISIDESNGSRIGLDLGRVRGTAEVMLNDRLVGVRAWSPYRFELTEAAGPGLNRLEIRVFNTLAPYLQVTTATPYVFPGQTISGLLGPVRLVFGE